MAHAHTPRALPSFAPIAREQLWFFVSMLLRAWPVALLAMASVVTIAMQGGIEPDARLIVSTLLAVFLALAAWPQQKTAGGLAYFRSLPPPHSINAALRAGVFWIVLIGLSMASFLVIESRFDIESRLVSALVTESAYAGAIPFPVSGPALVGGTFAFLILATGFSSTRYPTLWLQPFIWAVLLWRRLEDWAVGSALRPVFEGRYGMRTAFTGRFLPPAPYGAASYVVIEPKTWLLASALWLAAGLGIFTFAITRRREY